MDDAIIIFVNFSTNQAVHYKIVESLKAHRAIKLSSRNTHDAHPKENKMQRSQEEKRSGNE